MWPKIISLLAERGFSQSKVAQLVRVDQSTICRLSEGKAPEPRYSVACALIDLAGGADALRQHGIAVPIPGTTTAAETGDLERAAGTPATAAGVA